MYDDLPDVAYDASCKSDTPPVNPDVAVDISSGEDQWVRIPVTSVETTVNKDGPASITRTAKLKFPAEWEEVSIIDFINGFTGSEDGEIEFDRCRIFYRDQQHDFWQIAHYGYVGSVGPAAENGVMKLWVYDPADLLRTIPVSKSYTEPTIAEVIEFIANGVDERGDDVGLNNRTVFDNVGTAIAGIHEVAEGIEDAQSKDISGPLAFGADIIDDIKTGLYGEGAVASLHEKMMGQKRFTANRHNMLDVIQWFADEVGGKWHFEPTPDGPVLFYDNRGEEDGYVTRRNFVMEELVGEVDGTINEIDPSFFDGDFFSTTDVLNNDALVDIKPLNTLYLHGDATTKRERYPNLGYSASPTPMTSKYPVATVKYPPLLERAGGYTYSTSVESDAVYLHQAANEAVSQFREYLAESTEGNIELKGEPHILPFDYITVSPVCNDLFENADAPPLRYEVNTVTHKRKAGERYTTELGVSIAIQEEKIEVDAEYVKA